MADLPKPRGFSRRRRWHAALTQLCWLVMVFATSLTGTTAMATEEPPFTAALTAGAFQLRDYPEMVTAEVLVTGSRKTAASKGFRLLAGYIFGANTARAKIAMTAPVVQIPQSQKIAMTAPVLQTGTGNDWTIRFIMPRGYTLATLPRPNNPAVVLRAVPPVRIAVVRFSGLAAEDDVAQQTALLQQFLVAHHLTATGAPSLAQYDPPWTLWFLRRNEIMIPVAR